MSAGSRTELDATLNEYADCAYVEVAAESRDPAAVVRETLAVFDMLAQQGPSEEEMDRVRRRIGRWPQEMADSPEDAVDFLAREVLYGRGSTVEAHAKRLARVTADEVRDAARELAVPERLHIVTGSLRARQRADLRAAVKAWRTASKSRPTPSASPGPRSASRSPR